MKSIKKVFCPAFIFMYTLTNILYMSGCTKESNSNPALPIRIPDSIVVDSNLIPKAYLALGDSYTIGQSVSTDQRFPVQTVGLLTLQGVQMRQAEFVATTGWTTGNLISSLVNNPPIKIFDFVTLLIGVNNQYQGRSQDEYRQQFTDLLSKAVFYAGNRKKRVFVLSIPDYSVTVFAQNSDTVRIAREIDEFNAINKHIADSAGITYLDITPISREARTNLSLIATDGLHPSGLQYQRWASLLAPLMKAAL